MVLRAFLTAVLAMALAAGRPSAQSASAPLRFEAASIKPNRSGDAGGGLRLLPERLDAVNVPAWMLVMDAHELRPYQLVGGPGWLQQDKFDVRATTGPGASRADVSLMLRTLLNERFALSVHEEQRDVRGYALVRARGDGKLGPGLTPPCRANCPKTYAGFNWSAGVMEERSVTIADVADALTAVMRSPVSDRTGVTETFDVVLRWSVEPADAGAPDAPAVAFRRAVEEQLGLKLEASRETVKVLVIDRIERPTPD